MLRDSSNYLINLQEIGLNINKSDIESKRINKY